MNFASRRRGCQEQDGSRQNPRRKRGISCDIGRYGAAEVRNSALVVKHLAHPPDILDQLPVVERMKNGQIDFFIGQQRIVRFVVDFQQQGQAELFALQSQVRYQGRDGAYP